MILEEKFLLKTKGMYDIIDITQKVEEIVKKTKVKRGIVIVSCPGSTAAITTIEFEPNLILDFKEFLRKLVPPERNYRHYQTWGEKNAFSHILSALFKTSLVVPIMDGKIFLGTWQQIVFCDFDERPREREILITVFGEN